MTDATERRLAGLLAPINEMLDNRLPKEGVKPSGLSMWQFWVAIGTMIFYTGATWIKIEDNTEDNKLQNEQIKSNSDSLAAHFQWELEHELAAKDAEIRKLKARK